MTKTPLLNGTTKRAIHSLYKHIRNGEKKWVSGQQMQIQQSSLEIKPGSEMVKSSGYPLIPKEIRLSLDHSRHFQQTYQFNVNGRTCQMVLVFPISTTIQDPKTILKYFHDVVHKTFLWLNVATQYAPAQCSKHIHISMYFSDHTKILARNRIEPLDVIHANTAFTTSCQTSTDIVLFRREEWFKVLIHETFHNLGLDFSNLDNREANRRILEIFPVAVKEVRLYESYCETWATLIHTLFLSFLTTRNKDDWGRIATKMEGAIKIEILFSLFQCTKVLHHYHLSYHNLVQLEDPKAKEVRKKYNEKTHIFSYYVIKAILLSHPNEFVKWCLTNNGDHFLRFSPSQQNIIRFVQLVREVYREKGMLNLLEQMDGWFQTNSHWMANTFSGKTMKMTSFG